MIFMKLRKEIMKIIIINGSHRKNGSTALILNGLSEELKKRDDHALRLVALDPIG